MLKNILIIFLCITHLGFSQNLLIELEEKSKNSKTESIKINPSTNLLDLNKIDNFSALDILDSSLVKNQVFFIGEDHRYRKSNSELLLKLFAYLNQKIGLRDILIEQGISSAFLINKYIVDGDEEAKKTLENYVFPTYFDLFTSLKHFNDTILLDSLKVRVHGIDIERSLQNGFKVLGKLLPKTTAPADIAVSIETISGMAGYYDYQFANMKSDSINNPDMRKIFSENQFNGNKTLKHILDNYKLYKDIYKSYLEENYNLFNQILEGLDKGQEWYSLQEESAYQEWIMREIYMAERFKDLITKNPNKTYLGSFGRCHTSINITDAWCDLHQFKSLANRIREIQLNHSDSKLKVLSIGSYYPLSGYFARKKSDGFMVSELTKQVSDNEVRIFKVSNDTNFAQVKDAFQFIVINKRKLQEEKKGKLDVVFVDEDLDDLFTHIDFNYTFYSFNNSSFNNLIHSFGFKKPSDVLESMGLGLIFHDKELTIGLRYNQSSLINYSSQNQNHSLNFRARQFNIDILGNLTESNVFLLSPGISLGIGEFVFKEELINPNSIFDTPILNRFSTPLYALSPIIQTRLNLKFISIGAHGGYQWDFSRGYLSDSKNDRVLDNQKFKGTGWFWGLNASFYFSKF
jgi:hypothetical protein